MIRTEGVRVRYGAATVLHDMDVQVALGEWVGLIGPNGAGKTTLLRAIVRLVEHEGVVRIEDSPTTVLSRRRIAQLVAVVPQQPELPPGMTVAEYVLLGRTAHVGYFGFESGTDRRMCAELLERLDLAGGRDRHLVTLSGGELQRLVLARALAQRAPVLLLDEPTSALDLGRRIDVLELVDEMRREQGLTVLAAMHDLTLAGQFADRLVLISEGRVVVEGAAGEVLTESLLAHHYGAEVQVLAGGDGEIVVAPRRVRVPARR